MRTALEILRRVGPGFLRLGAVAAIVVACSASGAIPAKKKAVSAPAVGKSETQSAASARPDFTSLPKSVFTTPSSPAEGRNPFFSKSVVVAQAPQPTTKQPATLDPTLFVLNGITGPPLRSVMINGRTFLTGEEGEVQLQSGSKILIKCAEIGDEKAVIEVGGVRRELRLRFGI